MDLAAAPVLFLSTFAACFWLAASARRRPLALSAALGAAAMVCLESLLLNLLSLVHAVGRPGIVAGHALILLAAGVTLRHRRRPRLRWPRGGLGGVRTSVAALGALAALSAAAYRPNNWDSMTYHLARVAHWAQNHSVGPYPTNVLRQRVMPPGAEHLLLVLQIAAGSDAFANFVQLGAWILVAAAAPALARSFGAPRRVARWGLVWAGAAPMALMQASSTQNDLLAAAMAVAIVAASIPFLHRRCRWRGADAAALVVAVTAGLLVKPTSAVAAAPFLLWALARSASGLARPAAWRALAPAALALPLALGALGPSWLARREVPGFAAMTRPYLYLGAEQPGDRLVNAARGVLRNLPLPLAPLDRLAPPRTEGCPRAGSMCLDYNLALNEDATGNPCGALLVLLALVVGLTRLRSLPPRSVGALACLLGAWVLFHAVFRDNVWIPRLQLALFALAPIALCAWSARGFEEGLPGLAAGLLVVGLLASGALAVAQNARRPLDPLKVLRGRSDEAYYLLGPPGVAQAHAAALSALERSSCRRLGLFIGEDSYDYPLTWRAMRRGVAVRHVLGPDDWPCAVFSDRGPPPGRPSGEAWQPEGADLYLAPGTVRSPAER